MADKEESNGGTTAVMERPKAPVALNVGVKGLMPTDLDSLWRLSTIIASSDLAPKQYKGSPGNCAVAIQLGMELGLSPMGALQNIAVVNGRPSVWGAGLLGLVEASGLLEEREEWFSLDGQRLEPGIIPTKDGKRDFAETFTAHCRVKRHRRPSAEYTFSVGDAKRAGLWGKEGPWQQYPQRMLMWRARGFAFNDEFADVLKGLVMLREEAIDITPEPDEGTPPPRERPTVAVQDILDATATSKPQGEEPDPPKEKPKAALKAAKKEPKPEPAPPPVEPPPPAPATEAKKAEPAVETAGEEKGLFDV